MVKEREIRELIFERIRELYKLRRNSEKFVAGESKIPYARRVYNEKEMINLADAGHVYDAEEMKIENHSNMRQKIREVIRSKGGPIMVDVVLDPMQPFSPRVTSERKSDGRMVSKPLEDMYPFLDRDKFKKEMIIKPMDE